MANEALNLRPAWQKLAARLQHEARKTSGYAIIIAPAIFINGNGDPITWLEPLMIRLEPKGLCDLDTALKTLLGLDETRKT